MEREALLNLIETLPEETPMHRTLERDLRIGVGFGNAWYRSQKEHWLKWLAEYETPGVYGRAPDQGRDCQFIYNHLQCPPMVFWLPEALGLPKDALTAAYEAATGAPRHHARQSAAIRAEIPWQVVESRIHQLSEGGATRCNGQPVPASAPSAKLQRVAIRLHKSAFSGKAPNDFR